MPQGQLPHQVAAHAMFPAMDFFHDTITGYQSGYLNGAKAALIQAPQNLLDNKNSYPDDKRAQHHHYAH